MSVDTQREYEFLIGREILRLGAGSLIYVPKGTLHAHRNVGEGGWQPGPAVWPVTTSVLPC